jgi:hypothetical protein
MDVFTSIDVNDFVIKASQTDDSTGTVLRVHLLCEKMVEAWVCASTGFPHLLDDDGSQLLIECSAKLKLAKNTGLPVSLYKAFKVINTLRNDIAHNPSKQEIPDNKIASLRSNLDNHLRLKGKELTGKHYIKTFDENGDDLAYVTFDSEEPSNKLKLSLALNIIVGEMAVEVASRNKKWDNDFRQK